ncbi:hypothetical protein LFM09_04415 [Lentzea alba]|uniref:hypothetical protein n=1 Tax=Lentzea alba TaxID=2714351 RepID=UPI0039BF4440
MIRALTAALLAAALTGCTGTESPERANTWYLLDADSSGAIVIGGTPLMIRGVDRSGRVAWEKPASDTPVVCEERCPAVHDTAPVAGSSAWQPTSDDSVALAMIPRQNDVQVRRYVREPSGWAFDESSAWTAATEFGCTAANRAAVILAMPSPTLRTKEGDRPIPELEAGSECAFNRDGAVIVQNDLRGSKVVTVSADGKLLTTKNFGVEARVRADARSDAVAVVSGGTATASTLTGEVLKRETGVDDARFDETGALVLVDRAGVVRWS